MNTDGDKTQRIAQLEAELSTLRAELNELHEIAFNRLAELERLGRLDVEALYDGWLDLLPAAAAAHVERWRELDQTTRLRVEGAFADAFRRQP